MDISFQSNIALWAQSLTAVQRQQLPFATASALTDVARLDVKPAIERRIDAAFDRPTRFTQAAVAVRWATRLSLTSTVLVKDVQRGYLLLEETGGTRLPRNRAIALPVGQRVDTFGNLPRGTVARLLARKDTFSGRVHGRAGVWQRTRKGVKLLVAWEPETRYRPRFRFHETAAAAATLAFPARFEASLANALATASP